ncbi:MAG: LysR family transcriptional regulator, partial [Clostridia bacterium]|nr:LysR family transcriptional regulator [Clostridia bacterium]
MDIKDIRYFVAIAEEHSMSKAARELFVSQPTLSQVVSKLEQEFDTALFIRKGNALILTAAGESLLNSGRALLAQHESIVTTLHSLSSAKEETIVFGIAGFYSRQYIPDLFAYCRENMPTVHLKPCENTSSNLEQMVIDGELPFCFVTAAPQREELVYRTIDIEEYLLAISKGHPANKYAISSLGRPYMEFSRVRDASFILHKGTKTTLQCDRLFRHYDFTPNVVFETSHFETMYALTSLGFGVCLLPETITTMPLPYEKPNFYRLSDVEMLSNYAVAYRPDRKLNPSEEALVDIMARLIAKKKRGGAQG